MERITLYHRGLPVTRHTLSKEPFTIGSAPSNDLVLAAGSVRERHLTLNRRPNGSWCAVGSDGDDSPEIEMDTGARIALGPYCVAVESAPDWVEPSRNISEPLIGSARREDGPEGRAAAEQVFSRLGWAGRSAPTQQLQDEIRLLAPLSGPVLVTGESGTGKELAARALHELSLRADGPFVAVNCGGLTDSLLEDTLFGHERGAFTGAAASRKGVFLQAHGGTLFLDEIGDLPLPSQASLLRVLDEKRVCPIGAEGGMQVDFRLVTATHRDLAQMVRKKLFRLDLYHRISTLCVKTFPLRDHLEDVWDIAAHYFDTLRIELGERMLGKGAFAKIASYRWPGNVRELRNVLYRSAALTRGPLVDATDIDIPHTGSQRVQTNLTKISPAHLVRVLTLHKGNVAAAARTLGVPRTSLRDRLKAGDIRLEGVMELAG